jgi:hypothetical protein
LLRARVAPSSARSKLKQLLKKTQKHHKRGASDLVPMRRPKKDLIRRLCEACRASGLGAAICKRGDAPNLAARDWIKGRYGKRWEFLICRFTEPEKPATDRLGAFSQGDSRRKGKLQWRAVMGGGF